MIVLGTILAVQSFAADISPWQAISLKIACTPGAQGRYCERGGFQVGPNGLFRVNNSGQQDSLSRWQFRPIEAAANVLMSTPFNKLAPVCMAMNLPDWLLLERIEIVLKNGTVATVLEKSREHGLCFVGDEGTIGSLRSAMQNAYGQLDGPIFH